MRANAERRKRSRFQIYFDTLRLLREETQFNEKPSLTRVAHEANLPYDRFQKCLEHFVQLGMVSYEEGKIAVTRKGLEYVRECEKIDSFLRRMGLLL